MASSAQPKKVALFDVCQTLVGLTTITDFTESVLLSRSRNPHFSAWKALSHVFYKTGRSLHLVGPQYRTHLIRLYAGYSKAMLAPLVEQYCLKLQTVFKHEIRERLESCKERGYEVYLVSGGLNVYLEPFARALGVGLICSVLEEDPQGVFTGRLAGIDCLGEGKVSKVREILGSGVNWEGSIAYGDSYSDIPVLSLVGTAYAVDPGPEFAAYAGTHSWPVIKTARAATIVTFANLGKKRNIPTADIAPVIDVFARKGALDRIICQVHQDFYFPHTMSAVPAGFRFGLRMVERFTGRTLRFWTEALFDWFAARKIGKPRALIFHGGYFLPRTLRRAKAAGAITIDIIRTAHPAENARIEQTEYDALTISEADRPFKRIVTHHTHHNDFAYVIALSEFGKQSYIAHGYPAERIFVAHPDVDIKRFTPAETKPAAFTLIYAAYTAPLKGLGYLLDAWDDLALPDAKLILLGGYGDMPKALSDRYTARISANPTIQWVESTPHPEEFYRQASALVFPSLTEGFGRVTLEAMACGLPVITTEHASGIVEEGKTGFLVPIRDPQAFKEKIVYLYHNRTAAEEMGRNARTAAEEKTPFGEAVYAIYEEILRREENL